MKALGGVILAGLLTLPLHAESLAFGLFGDTPYHHRECETLPDLMAEMDRENLAFVIHDGDIKSGAALCSDEVLLDIRDHFRRSATQLVYVPGDNESTDCHRKSNGSYDPLERLARIREWFFADDLVPGKRTLRPERQSRSPGFAS